MQSLHKVEADMPWLLRANRPRLTRPDPIDPDQSRGNAKKISQIEFAARAQLSMHQECSKSTDYTKIMVSVPITRALALDQRGCGAIKILRQFRIHPSSSGDGKRVHGMLTAPVYGDPSRYIAASSSRFCVPSNSGGRSQKYSRSCSCTSHIWQGFTVHKSGDRGPRRFYEG